MHACEPFLRRRQDFAAVRMSQRKKHAKVCVGILPVARYGASFGRCESCHTIVMARTNVRRIVAFRASGLLRGSWDLEAHKEAKYPYSRSQGILARDY